jgi:hypothetical protein
MCYTYNAGECYSGSSAGTLYVNVPNAYNLGYCGVGMSWLVAPCVMIGFPGGGWFREQDIGSGTDPTGQGSRGLSTGLVKPGDAYPYAAFDISPDGTFGLYAGPVFQNWNTVAWLAKLPPFQRDSANRTELGGITVEVPSGHAFAVVQFGYSRYVGAGASPVSNFLCTPRAESCDTSTTVSPFAFASESSTATSCASGCSITLPVAAGNIVYYRVGTSPDDSTWTWQDTQAVALP